MSLKPQAISPVPAETARVARAAYPKGNVCMQMRDILGSIYTDEDFADLFRHRWATRRGSVATGSRHCAPICGEPVR